MSTEPAALLEREHELGVLGDALERARSGAGALVVIQGPAGIGKSRLLEAAVQRAREMGLQCLRGRGAELERAMAFGVARQVLEPALLRAGSAEHKLLLDKLVGGAGTVPAEPESANLGPPRDQAARVDALYWLVYQMTHRPASGSGTSGALIAVDDAQWADVSSLRLLLRLTLGLDELPISIAVAVRSGDRDPDGLLLRLRGHRDGSVLYPATLSTTAVATLVKEGLGDDAEPELCLACATATGGNPFLVRELLASFHARHVAPTAQALADLAGTVPAAVRHSVQLRLAQLSGGARVLAEAAAMLGPDAPLHLGAAVAELGADEAGLAADTLVAANVLCCGDPLVFAHPLIADAVGADVGRHAQARAHRRAAEHLAAGGGSRDRVAAHLRLTAPSGDSWVVSVLRAAAGAAIASGDAPSAAHLLERALAEPPPPAMRSSVLGELARAEAASGSPRALDRLAEASDGAGDAHERARTLQAMSRLLFARGNIRAAVDAAARGRAALAPGDPLAAHMLASQVASMFFVPDAWPETERLLGELERGLECGRLPKDPLLLAQVATSRAVWRREPAARVRPLAEAALATEPAPDEVWQGDASLAAALIYVDEYELAERVLDRMDVRSRRTGSPISAAMAAHWRGEMRYQQGWVADAAAEAQRALDAGAMGWTSETAWAVSLLAQARLELADLRGAQAAIAIGAHVDPGQLSYGFVLHARGEVELAAGAAGAALQSFSAAGAHLRDRYALANPAVVAWRAGAAAALVALGNTAEAGELARAELEDAWASGTPHAVGAALRAAAAAAAGPGRIAFLRQAVEVLAPSGAQLEHVRAVCDLGAALRHRRHTGAANERLHQALALARRLGATATAHRALRELRLSGVHPEPFPGDDQATALTPGERRVAELAAQDRSNEQIARLLFVTRRTVEWHLTQSYRKLGIRSRAGLAHALRAGDDP